MINKTKKLLRLCFVVTICIALQGCGKQKNTSKIEQSNEKNLSEEMTYIGNDIIIDGIVGEIKGSTMKDGNLYIITEKQGTDYIYKTNKDGRNAVEICKQLDGLNIMSFCIDKYNNYICLADDNKQGYPTVLIQIDDEGKLILKKSLNEIHSLSDNVVLNQINMDENGNVILANKDVIYVIDLLSEDVSEIKAPNNKSICSVIKTNSDSCACVMKTNEGIVGEDDAHEDMDVCIVDLNKKEWTNGIKMPEHPFVDEYCLMEGQEYDFYYKDGGGIFGYDLNTSSWNKIMDARSSLLTVEDMKNMLIEDDGDFLKYSSNNVAEEVSGLELYSKYNPENADDKKIITIGGCNITNQMRKVIRLFNKSHDDCKVVVKIYEEDDEDKLIFDIMSGKAPDIFSISALQLSMNKLVKKGVLEDLSHYYENDTEIKLEDFTPSVLESLKVDGKLYCVTPYYFIISAVSSAKDVENKSGWDYEEMMDIMKKKGDDTIAFNTLDKTELLMNLLPESTSDYIDWESGKCDYNNKEYKKILKYCNNMCGYDDVDYEKMNEIIADKIKDGKVLALADAGVTVFSVQAAKQRLGEDITYIGMPVKDKKGSYFQFGEQYGVFSGSKVKDEAWELIRMVMFEDYQEGAVLDYPEFYPTRKDCLEWKFQTQMATEAYEDKYGNLIEPIEKESGVSEYGDVLQIGPASKEDVNIIKDLIARINKRMETDNDAVEIEYEELIKYFEGEQNLNKTVKMIQNRMTTYVNEQK